MLKKERRAGRPALIRGAALALVAASVSFAGASDASAHHINKRKAQRAQVAMASTADQNFRNSNASLRSPGSFSGIASFYGNESGNKTASGERFNHNAMTAAHRTLPFGTMVRVTYKDRSVVVRINDRGPFIRGRVIDLSKGAARAIGLTSRGVGHVHVARL